jgi:protein-L-isoaspartate(D-aspartate) O-methyltransferase
MLRLCRQRRRPLRAWLCVVVLAGWAGCHMQNRDSPDEFAAARQALLAELRAEGITDARVLAALERVPRQEFVRPGERAYAYVNEALPIGGGQTISQPYIVALMTELLELHGGERVLEVGTGSGYQAAVLATLAGEVYSIEIDPALADTARERLQHLGYGNVQVRCGDGFYGWEEAAPFDAVIITAAAPRIPERLLAQLKDGGALVMPLDEHGREVLIRVRHGAQGPTIERVAQVAFVPMRGAVRTPTP